ncbi:MAG: class II aldolase/adducin family protein [Deltaproteobacteria bacterium]|jgi:L-fuculose-phosphate aldolase|nr:class II aldolase/adducin family protein [Deltaproteobacteria bacterium]
MSSGSKLPAPKTSHEVCIEIVEIGRRLHARGWLAAADGNISYRMSDENILITPSGRHKGFLSETDICRMTVQNEILEGEPSSERLMHLAIFQNVNKAKAVVHAHPPVATAWTIARPELTELPAECLSEVILAAGRIPFVPYARPGTKQMGDYLLPFLPDCRLMILSRHGALAWGETLEEAYNGIERLEHAAVTLAYAESLGGLTMLPPEEIANLRRMRSNMDGRTL